MLSADVSGDTLQVLRAEGLIAASDLTTAVLSRVQSIEIVGLEHLVTELSERDALAVAVTIA